MANFAGRIEQVINAQVDFLDKIDKTLLKLPSGSLYCNRKKKHMYYYQCTSEENRRHQTYLGTANGKNAQLVSELKRKRFLLRCKKVLEGNVDALRACLMKYEEFDPVEISSRMAASYDNIEDGQNLLCAKGIDQNDQRMEWQNAPYSKAEMHPESLRHESIGGLMVRSKSEALIAFALDLAHVPFHYEEILEMEGKKIAPDFAILHPVTGEKVYWEHFGMMDDAAYATETYRKLVLYGQNGILPGQKLIYTMETEDEPLGIREVQRIVACNFA